MTTSTLPPPRTVRPLPKKVVSRRVKFIDRTADALIRTSGVGIIVIVALIFVFLGIETLPLFRGAQQQIVFEQKLPGATAAAGVLALGVDEYESHVYYVDAAAGAVRFIDTATRQTDSEFPLKSLAGTRATAAYRTRTRD